VPLSLVAGQYSDKGRKPSNQDFHGICLPGGHRLDSKGAAVALADGISSSPHARQASQAAVTSFLEDYYCTSEAWSVRRSAERVLAAANSWLFAQTQQGQGRYDKDRGWTCTFSAIVFRSRTAHLFHVGDARIHQVQGRTLEQLTTDHRVHVGGGQSYLGRAFGIGPQVEVDYRTVPLEVGDTFVLATDGVHAFVRPSEVWLCSSAWRRPRPAARAIADAALQPKAATTTSRCRCCASRRCRGTSRSEVARQAAELLPAPELRPGMTWTAGRSCASCTAAAAATSTWRSTPPAASPPR
jgi:serine/threonine protein phosphatase PrpC